MESLTTAQAAERCGVPNHATFLRLAARHNIGPVMSAPGLRGAKFWSPDDVDQLAAIADQVTT